MSPQRGRPSRVVRDVSAGGVIARWQSGEVELVLVGHEHPKRWTIPKGTPLLGETIAQAAIREVGEETGLRVCIVEPLGEIRYGFAVRGTRHHKTVHFFLLEAIGGDTADHDWEHDYAEWVPAAEALRRISFPNEASILEQAVGRVQAKRFPLSWGEASCLAAAGSPPPGRDRGGAARPQGPPES